MKPDDILNAIGDVDDAYIRKAHQKSFIKALAVFMVIVIVGIAIAYSQLPDYHLQLRYNPDSSVITEYIEPEAIIHNKWTSLEYTAYQNGEVQSSTLFQRRFNPNYIINHTENSETTKIVGSNGDTYWPSDYLGDAHYTNLYIRTMYSTDLLDRIDMVYINSEAAYGVLNQQLNCIKLEYSEHSEVVSRQYLVKNGRTEDEEVIRSRGYDLSNQKISGWKEWDANWNLLSYAEYHYDGNTQTVSEYLADGTLIGTRVSKYAFGDLRWREYYNPQGDLIGKEVYRYRFWEPFLCFEGCFILLLILSLAVTMAFAIWDDRIKFGDRLVFLNSRTTKEDSILLCEKMDRLSIRVDKLTAQLEKTDSQNLRDEITALTVEINELNDQLSEFWNGKSNGE